MKLSDAKKLLGTQKMMFRINGREEMAVAIDTLLKYVEELQKENELARKSLIENSNIADERNDLLVEVQKLKKENEELKTDTRNRAIGCRDLVKKCEVCDFKECIGCEYSISDISATLKNFISKDKIKEKIEELKAATETCYGRIKYQEGKIAGLEELLKGE